jgi:hypothetical protein
MAKITFQLPIKGFSSFLPAEGQPQLTTPIMMNVRAPSSSEQKLRLGPRPGLRKVFPQRIGGNSLFPIIELLSVSVTGSGTAAVVTSIAEPEIPE